ncbi:MAG: DegT/DnrJ/EryC1/StrS family aminotransferase [Acidobacteriota bacterium]
MKRSFGDFKRLISPVTCGDGGIVATKDREACHRAMTYHGLVGALGEIVPPARLLPALNLRMTELQATVQRSLRARPTPAMSRG